MYTGDRRAKITNRVDFWESGRSNDAACFQLYLLSLGEISVYVPEGMRPMLPKLWKEFMSP